MAQSFAGLSTTRSRCVLVLAAVAVALTALLVCVGGSAYAQGYENTATARDGSGYIEGSVEGSSGLYYAKAEKQHHAVVTANSGNAADAYAFALVNANDESAQPVTPDYSVEKGATGAFTLLANPTEKQFADALLAGKDKDFDAVAAYKQAKRLLYAALVDPDDLKGTYNLTDADLWELVNAEMGKLADPAAKSGFTGDKAKAFKALSDYAQTDAADKAADFAKLEVHLYLACGDSPKGMVNLVSACFVQKEATADGVKKIDVPSWKAEGTTDVTVEQIYVDADGLLVDWPEGAAATIELYKNGEATGQTAELTADNPKATFEGVRNDTVCSFATAEPIGTIAYTWGGTESGYTIASLEGAQGGDTAITVGAEFYGLDGTTKLEEGLPASVKARVLVDGEEAAVVEPGADNGWDASADVVLPESGLVSIAGEAVEGFDLVLIRGDIDGVFTLVYQEKGYIVPVAALDNATGDQVAGAGLRATGTTDAGLATSVDLTTTTGDDTMILPAGSFKLQQVTDPEGFKAMADVDFQVMDEGDGGSVATDDDTAGNENADDGSINLMEDSGKTAVRIIKVDKEKYDALTDKGDAEALAGATLSISGTSSDGESVVETMTTTANAGGDSISLAAGSYTLTETEAPAGFVMAADAVSFTVTEDGKVTDCDSYNSDLGMIVLGNIRTKVIVSKRIKDKTDELSGATLQIQDSEGGKVVEWTTSTRAKAIRELSAGEYKLVEISAPTGYDKADPIEFVMNEDGTVEVKDGDDYKAAENNQLVMYDAPNGILKTKSPVTNGANGGSSLAKTGDGNGLIGLGIIALLGGAMVVEGMVLARRRRDRD